MIYKKLMDRLRGIYTLCSVHFFYLLMQLNDQYFNVRSFENYFFCIGFIPGIHSDNVNAF